MKESTEKEVYRMFCPNCDHEFTYQKEQLRKGNGGDLWIICPKCGSALQHKRGNYSVEHISTMQA